MEIMEVMEVMDEWYGMADREFAESRYRRTDFIPRKPFPCIEGLRNTMEFYDSNEMRRYTAEDFLTTASCANLTTVASSTVYTTDGTVCPW